MNQLLKNMKVIGIDPGIRNTGIAVVGYDQYNKKKVFNSHLITSTSKIDYETALVKIGDKLQEIIKPYQYPFAVLAIESIFIGPNINSAINTGKVIGIARYIAHMHLLPYYEINPQTVKSALAVGRQGSKDMILKRVEQLTGIKCDNHHIADAIGIAIACHLKLRNNINKNNIA